MGDFLRPDRERRQFFTTPIFREDFRTYKMVERRFADLDFGNSGLQLAFVCNSGGDPKPEWQMHFRPEFKVDRVMGKRVKYSRMFAAGFISMAKYLTSQVDRENPQLAEILHNHPPHGVGFNTSDHMWNFASKMVGETYFIRPSIEEVLAPYRNRPKVQEALKKSMQVHGRSGIFFWLDF